MKRTIYTSEFKEQALRQVRERGSTTLPTVAAQLNVEIGTLYGWIKRRNREEAGLPHGATQLPHALPAAQWSAAQRLQALLDSYAFEGEALAAWCREKGLFEHQLASWRLGFCHPSTSVANSVATTGAELRSLQVKHVQLQKELRRKEAALSEAAALLVLQKKFRALWVDEA